MDPVAHSKSSSDLSTHPDAQWMVRTAQNVMKGPYSIDEIRDFIQSSKLTTLDEVCPSGGYWFFLHEAEEVETQLGVAPPLPLHAAEDEVTQTEVMEELKDDEDGEHGTSVVSRTPKRRHSRAEVIVRPGPSLNDPMQWTKRVEPVSYWKAVTIVMTAVAVILFLGILKLFRHSFH
jgi:hypothetical protein